MIPPPLKCFHHCAQTLRRRKQNSIFMKYNWYSQVRQLFSILGLVPNNLGLPSFFLTISSFASEILAAVSGVISSIAASQLIG